MEGKIRAQKERKKLVNGKKFLSEYACRLWFNPIPLRYFSIRYLIIWPFFVRFLLNIANDERRATKMRASNFDAEQKYFPNDYVELRQFYFQKNDKP